MLENIKFIQYNESYNQDIINLWNEEIGFIFKLESKIFSQKVNNKYLFKEGSILAFLDNKLVGFIISKVYDNNKNIPKYYDYGWISLFYVGFKYRKQGIGNYLLVNAEEKLVKYGVKTIQVGSDLENFFPGIPADFDNLTDSFFRKRGYDVSRYTHDLLKIITKDDLLENDSLIILSNNKEIIFRYATADDKDILLKFLEKCFFGRWYDEAYSYFLDNDIVSEYLMAVDGEKVVGFLRVNFGFINKVSYNNTWKYNFDNNLVGIGPLGVDPEYRGYGIAKHLIMKSLSDAYKHNITKAMIDWTGLMHIYQKYGFQVWKCYAYTMKKM